MMRVVWLCLILISMAISLIIIMVIGTRQIEDRIDNMDRQISAIERSVEILPGNNPTEKPP